MNLCNAQHCAAHTDLEPYGSGADPWKEVERVRDATVAILQNTPMFEPAPKRALQHQSAEVVPHDNFDIFDEVFAEVHLKRGESPLDPKPRHKPRYKRRG